MGCRRSFLFLLAPLILAGLARSLSLAQLPPPQAPSTATAPFTPISGETRTVRLGPINPIQPAPPPVNVHLKAPPLEACDLPLPINLAAALRLADDRPVGIAAAQASAWVAEAQLFRARVFWVPEFDMSAVYTRHDGFGPDFNRGTNRVFDINSQALPINQNVNYFYGGIGLYTVWHPTDAIFLPRAARQNLDARRWDIQTAKNDALLMTAIAYFNVHRYRGMYAGALDAVERGKKLVERLTGLSKDLIPRVEVERSHRMLADLEQEAAIARANWRIASADLTQVLRLDPRAVVVPLEPDHLQLTLFEPSRPLDELLPIALRTRPELAAQQSMIQLAQVRIRQEKVRPLLPKVLISGFQNPGDMRTQFGAFALGRGNRMDNWSIRDDVSAQLVWQLESFGLGNFARIKEQRGQESRALAELFRRQDAIAAEITRSQADLQSAAVRVGEAERGLRQSLITYEGNYEGLRQTKRFENVLIQIYRPQEVVVALENLKRSYDLYFTTVAEYNRAQFQLFHALGYPAREIARFRSPGEPVPVNTTRPALLPPVGIGPPPASR